MTGFNGVMKDKPIGIRQENLSYQLRGLWGPPKRLPKTKAENAIGDKDGVISFFRIPTYVLGGRLGGRIGLVDDKDFATPNFSVFLETKG